jgi:hypothetical protein
MVRNSSGKRDSGRGPVLNALRTLGLMVSVSVVFIFGLLILWTLLDMLLGGEPVNVLFRWFRKHAPFVGE